MGATTRRAAALALLVPLAGCVNMSGLSGESKYACAAPEGVACNSVSGTYANAVAHNLPSQRGGPSVPRGAGEDAASPTATPPMNDRAKSSAIAIPSRQPLAGTLASIAQPGADGRPSVALRSQARVLRLWTKPWEDADGDLWDQGFVYVQVDAGRWQIDHVRQRIRDQYLPLRPPAAATTGTAPGAPAGPAAAEPGAAPPAEGALQRPSSLRPFPSLTQPPTGLGSRIP